MLNRRRDDRCRCPALRKAQDPIKRALLAAKLRKRLNGALPADVAFFTAHPPGARLLLERVIGARRRRVRVGCVRKGLNVMRPIGKDKLGNVCVRCSAHTLTLFLQCHEPLAERKLVHRIAMKQKHPELLARSGGCHGKWRPTRGGDRTGRTCTPQ